MCSRDVNNLQQAGNSTLSMEVKSRFWVGSRRLIGFVADEPCERCAAFMPLQCGICEGIRIVPILLDMSTLRRNKFRDPRFMVTKRVKFRKETTHESSRFNQVLAATKSPSENMTSPPPFPEKPGSSTASPYRSGSRNCDLQKQGETIPRIFRRRYGLARLLLLGQSPCNPGVIGSR